MRPERCLRITACNPLKQDGNRRISKTAVADFQVLQHVWQIL